MGITSLKVAVVGAGISGLSLAYRLMKSGNDVTVFESSNVVGGKIGTIYKEGLQLDLGPLTVSETPALKELIDELGLESIEASDASKIRYIYSRGKLHHAGPFGSLLSFGGKLSMLKAIVTTGRSEDESVADYARRRFGKKAYQKLFNPLMNGIYAGNAELLSAKTVIKKRAPRKIISLKGGMASLTNALASKLQVRLNTASINFNEFDEVHITTPAFVASELVRKYDHKLADKLARIHYSSLSQVYVETVPGGIKFDGFGFLVPSEERMSLLGAVCISNILPSKVPDGRRLFVLFCGGDRPYDFNASVDGALDEFRKILQPAICKVLHVQEHKNGIPQFFVGHQEIIEEIRGFEQKHPKIRLKGNYISGVAVGDCL